MFVKVSEFKPKNLAFITKAKAKDFHDVLKDTQRPMPRTNIPDSPQILGTYPRYNVLRGILLGGNIYRLQIKVKG